MIEHTLNDADTIQGLSVLYNVPWQDIADYNNLEYPYTMTSRQAYYELYAGGYVRISRVQTNSELVIAAGGQFQTETDAQGIQKTYELIETATLTTGVAEGYFYVRSLVPGSYGNTIAGSIIVVGSIQTDSMYSNPITVTNPQPFTSGKDARVRLTGQVIYIDIANQTSKQPSSSYIEELGGIDLVTMPDNDITYDGAGDWDVVTGSENIQQAANHRLTTRRGSITQHPTYGSRLHELIGIAQAPYVQKLIELDVIETLMNDERIDTVTVNSIEMDITAIRVDISFTAAGTESQTTASVSA
ncbi:contractile injection system sheath initiator [Paenibacillus hunanensis]|uniref:Phage baseplate assembly protein W n=1 Tax=Paenibacillus hunanensis TaxID=539262 RepID=A0ABU1IVE2_9BACL|nr:DUF2634 domain-containing protein [Paenibacillus hunanensis]MDR6243139.1 phage baseplate assembly protein W [Paenibacillus hunanensis]GGJ11504.1 hypothetical protein GCM10008022_20860 [Paenibacillus hunanensis]